MAKNVKHRGTPNVTLPLAVASGTKSGEVLKIGSYGLTGLVLTDRATTTTIGDGTAAPGLADGQASVELIGVTAVVELKVAGGVSVGDAIYVASADTYNDTAAANDFIGWALEAISNNATGKVALASYTPTIVLS